MSMTEIEKVDAKLLRRINMSLSELDRGKTDDLHQGHITIYAHALTGKILRANILGPSAGEMLGALTIAMNNNVSLWKISGMTFAYPTLSEGIKKIADRFVIDTLRNIRSEIRNYLSVKINNFLHMHHQKLIAAAFWGGVIYVARQYMKANDLTFLSATQELALFLQGSAYGPLIYLIVYTLRPIILFPASLMVLLAGFVFGLGPGYIYAMIGGLTTAIIPYFIGKYTAQGGDDDDNAVGFKKYLKILKTNPFNTTLTMRFLFLPYDLVNILAGHAGAKFVPFILATLVGNIAGTFTFVAAGASLEGDFSTGDVSFNPVTFIISLVVLALSIGISKWFNNRKRRNQNEKIS